VVVETVGVGQSETAVSDMVDMFLVLLLPAGGDDLQGIKRGVMELADAVVVNKADGANVKAAEKARGEIANALHLFPVAPSGWTPPALACSVRTGAGVRELWSAIEEHSALTRGNGWRDAVRAQQQQQWMRALIEQGLRQQFESHSQVRELMPLLEREVTAGRTTPARAAQTLLQLFLKP
jgi:LAO/AO transport system kinase